MVLAGWFRVVPGGSGRFPLGSGWVPGGSGWVPGGSGRYRVGTAF